MKSRFDPDKSYAAQRDMNWFGWPNNLRIWVRLVTVILVGTICFGTGLIYWGTLQQRKVAVDQAKDFAESVKQMTMAGLTGMMITGQVAQRNIFLDQIRDSNHIESLKVFRGRPVVLQFGEGHAGELPNTAAEHAVLETGKSYHEVFVGASGVAAVLCLPLVLFIWYFISHWVTRPLRQITSGLTRIAAGDLETTSHLQSDGKDEIGLATEAFNRVMDKAKELLSEQRMSRIVFENSLEGIVVTDAGSRIQRRRLLRKAMCARLHKRYLRR